MASMTKAAVIATVRATIRDEIKKIPGLDGGDADKVEQKMRDHLEAPIGAYGVGRNIEAIKVVIEAAAWAVLAEKEKIVRVELDVSKVQADRFPVLDSLAMPGLYFADRGGSDRDGYYLRLHGTPEAIRWAACMVAHLPAEVVDEALGGLQGRRLF